MMEDRSGREGGFEEFEGSLLFFAKNEGDMFVGEAGKRNDNVGKIINEAIIKISKTKKRLHILFRGSGQSWMILTLSEAINNPSGVRM